MVGLLIDRLGWRSPFFVLGGFGLLGMVALKILFPKNGKKVATSQKSIGFRNAWRRLGRERSALGALCFAFFIFIANDNLFVVYGVWLEKTFSLSIVALGTGMIVIGVAEMLGESLTASLADRLGLKRSVVIGLVLSGLSYGVLPFLEQTLPFALVGLFIIFLTFDFTIVASLALCTELLSGSRATMMSGYWAAASMGRVVGALIGVPIWLAGGLIAIGLVSAATSALALTSLVWGLQGWR